ncbi:MAG: sigma-54 dependent transcriptional regulator [Flavobacteriales bacterium]|nr:sigma-54 dependent transcriptional regulator [Flavobacteriales bacterium]
MNTLQVKQRFGIIGQSDALDRAIETCIRVAPTDLSVLITGESGVGKEIMPQIIHQLSARKHNNYIAVNCGAIPEGTIDSELFGHEKGSFTGAQGARKGYFEEANGGTIFLDEVAELPIQTQVRLLRVLETGEYIKVGSSKVLKTDVRIVAATNVDIPKAIEKGNFREDLYYRLNTVPVRIPALRERKLDIHLLFRKFASDFAEKYRMPSIKLDNEAIKLLISHHWPGNIRQLKNITEQISVIEANREINADVLRKYLPEGSSTKLPMLASSTKESLSEREILYKLLFELKKDMNDMKKVIFEILQNNGNLEFSKENEDLAQRVLHDVISTDDISPISPADNNIDTNSFNRIQVDPFTDMNAEVVEESLSLEDKEIELIKKALEKHKGRRKNAARELGISERTLYRKIKEYDL